MTRVIGTSRAGRSCTAAGRAAVATDPDLPATPASPQPASGSRKNAGAASQGSQTGQPGPGTLAAWGSGDGDGDTRMVTARLLFVGVMGVMRAGR